MKRIASVLLVTVLLVVFGTGMVFAAGRQDQGASGEWKWERKLTFISPWGPGGGLWPTIDTLRPLVERIIKAPCEIQPVEGGGGLAGTVFAQKQPSDGYNFVLGTQSTVALDIQGSLGFDFRQEFIPVGKLVHSTKGIIASKIGAAGMFSDFKGFLDYVKAHPREVSVGMRSPGGADEASLIETLALAFKVPLSAAGDYVKVVGYSNGAEMNSAMAGGHIHCTLQGLNESPGLIESGDMIPLVVLSETRMKSYPNVPCTGEMGIASYIGTWRGVFARKGTSQAAIDALDKAMKEAWNTPEYQKFCAAEGYLERAGYESQADFKKLIDAEYITMTDFLRAAGKIK
jgi:tripartite-type tricarboxylate transporter receptor subunit TctC